MKKTPPERPVSCRRRQVIANVGIIAARFNTKIRIRMIPKKGLGIVRPVAPTLDPAYMVTNKRTLSVTPTIAFANIAIQYSLRLARPENVAYFFQNRATAVISPAP